MNRYAEYHLTQYTDNAKLKKRDSDKTDAVEISEFIDLQIVIGVCSSSAVSDYWCTNFWFNKFLEVQPTTIRLHQPTVCKLSLLTQFL